MKALQLTPVMGEVNRSAVEATVIQELPETSATYALRLHDNGSLTATRLGSGDNAVAADCAGGDLVALVRNGGIIRDSEWVFVACASSVGLNGLTPPLAVAVLEPGGLLAIGDRCWLISSLWHPEPMEAPVELRDKPCPVCGGELGRAPVVQCGCGRWTHLENASATHAADSLNCFTAASVCGGCGRRATLEPQLFPEVSDRLVGGLVVEEEFAWQ